MIYLVRPRKSPHRVRGINVEGPALLGEDAGERSIGHNPEPRLLRLLRDGRRTARCDELVRDPGRLVKDDERHTATRERRLASREERRRISSRGRQCLRQTEGTPSSALGG